MKISPPLVFTVAIGFVSLLEAQTPAPRGTPAPNWPFSPTGRTAGAAALNGSAAAPALSAAQLAAQAADHAKLLEGVKAIPRLGSPGPVVAYGPQAFPLAATADGKEALAAAGSLGKGRVVIFGHTGYLTPNEGDLGRLLANAARWCGGKDKPHVGVRGPKPSALADEGMSVESFQTPDEKSLARFDVVIMQAQDLTDPTVAEPLGKYVKKGGGWISGVTGWAFNQTSGGKDFATANLGNALLAEAGLAWTTATLTGGALEAPAEISPMLNAYTAIGALTPKLGAPAVDPKAVEQGMKTLQLALSSMPAASRPAFQRLLAPLLATAEKTAFPTPEKPLGVKDAAARGNVALAMSLARFLPAAEVKPNPAAESFPGRPPVSARAVSKTVSIDPTIPGWQSTGLYADAGAKISVKVPSECARGDYAVRIGCQTDSLESLEEWKRVPEITNSTRLTGPETLAANPFGGLIYIVVPDTAKQTAPFQVAIAGGIEAPLYVAGQTTDAQWEQMRQLAAPWAELACKGVILTVPIAVAREVKKPAELMQFWQSVVDAEDELSNFTKRRRPERIVPDVQISAGFMHSGYPIMVHLPQAKEMVTLEPGKWPGWGFYHELGHNHQQSAWTFDGTVEVTCNLFSLYVVQTVQKQPMTAGHGAVKPGVARQETRNVSARGRFLRYLEGRRLSCSRHLYPAH